MPHCDFCKSGIALIEMSRCYRIKAHEVRIVSADLVEAFDKNWLACPVCAVLFKHKQWDALVYRSVSEVGFLGDTGYETWLRAIWSRAFSIPEIFNPLHQKPQSKPAA